MLRTFVPPPTCSFFVMCISSLPSCSFEVHKNCRYVCLFTWARGLVLTNRERTVVSCIRFYLRHFIALGVTLEMLYTFWLQSQQRTAHCGIYLEALQTGARLLSYFHAAKPLHIGHYYIDFTCPSLRFLDSFPDLAWPCPCVSLRFLWCTRPSRGSTS